MNSDFQESENTARQTIREHLLTDERILWLGQPEPHVHFNSNDIFLIPFSLLWGGFALFWETMAITMFFFLSDDGMPIIFPLFGIPFVLIGLYLIFGRFIYKAYRKKKTYYAVTDKRAICLIQGNRQTFRDVNLKAIGTISKNVRGDGIGTIIFGQTGGGIFSFGHGLYRNTGMDLFMGTNSQVCFFDIKDADKVYKTIQNMRSI